MTPSLITHWLGLQLAGKSEDRKKNSRARVYVLVRIVMFLLMFSVVTGRHDNQLVIYDCRISSMFIAMLILY